MEVDTVTASINDLPNEVLEKIFSFLGPKVIKTASLTCSRWNEIISQSSEIMERYFQLNLIQPERMIKKAGELNRKFRHLKISQLNPSTLEGLNSNLKSLNLSNCTIDPSLLVVTLRHLHSLEVFIASVVEILKDPNDKVKLKKLTHLRLHKCNISLVGIFDVTSLKLFEISSINKTECDDIIKLLNDQPRLEELKMDGLLCQNFFATPEITSFPFHLKKLKITNANVTREGMEFLKVHFDTLTDLIINCSMQGDDSSIHSMPNLRSLEIPFHYFEKDVSIKNAAVKSLKLIGSFPKLVKAIKIFKLFPSIEHLDLNQTLINDKTEAISNIQKEYPQLKSIKLPHLMPKNLSPFFPCLKKFSVSKLRGSDQLMEMERFLTKHVASLEIVEIGIVKDSEFVKSLVINNIMNCPNLKAVIIGCESPLIVRMFNKKVNRVKPWTLKAMIKSSSADDFVVLKFIFPDDVAVWEERCRIYDDELIRELSTVEHYGNNAFVNKYK